ncbi:hypothetical protein [Pseudoalteromonas byunsanensis]|uniref:hypothetical protein n=1 Tax=Pseudoalteromonas byunsanensis TaxID=327939 RepID=UPI001586B79A|nr:hypothetical protein [Pseudoalteromonas byunsanensis]
MAENAVPTADPIGATIKPNIPCSSLPDCIADRKTRAAPNKPAPNPKVADMVTIEIKSS